MKKIYAGQIMAVVVLERESGEGDEIKAVRDALQFMLDQRPDAGLPVVRRLLAELNAPAP